MTAFVGTREDVDAYLSSRKGRADAQAAALAIFNDPEALAAHELAYDEGDLFPAVAREVDRLIRARDRGLQ